MKIREMKREEMEEVQNLRLKSYKEYEQFVSKEHWELLKNTLVSGNDLKSNASIYVTEVGGKIVGSVALFPPSIQAYDWNESVQEFPEIRMLSVDPEIRGKGIARALVEHCITISKEENNEQIGLHTASFMDKASSLYESMGFERIPELDLEPMNDGVIVKAYRMKLIRNT